MQHFSRPPPPLPVERKRSWHIEERWIHNRRRKLGGQIIRFTRGSYDEDSEMGFTNIHADLA